MSNIRANLVGAWRRPIVVCFHLCLVCVSNYAAFFLRFDGVIPASQAMLGWQMLPWLVMTRGAIFFPFKLYEGMWRYTSLSDLFNIVAGVGLSSVVFYVLVHHGFGEAGYSRTVFLIDAVLLICLMGSARLSRRVFRAAAREQGRRRVLIYGAGDAGAMIAREMSHDASFRCEPVGFIDDDPNRLGRRIHGLPIMGGRESLPEAIKNTNPDEVLIALPSAAAATVRDLVRALEPFEVKIKTLPSLRALIDGRVAVSQIRSLEVEDLLSRAKVGLDNRPVQNLVAGRRVLVTGAGGSIGSELCRQLTRLQPARLVLYERHENGLYEIFTELSDNGVGNLSPVLGDVTDQDRLNEVFGEHRPEILFHAAAHKHVPLMEGNPCEAVKNNVTGTRLLAEMAHKHRVRRFILVSTDKAVNPTSVMGATKRVSELLLQALALESGTSFYTVRFGNVLGSSGSVVPRFLQQITAGGPLTITHPEMRRYFMLISEAVELVLHAAAQEDAEGIYVLQMGDQVRVQDLARNLIRLSGLVPGRDIEIVFSGIRSGEKLEEELVCHGESAESSTIDGILRVQAAPQGDRDVFLSSLADLERLAAQNDERSVVRQLRSVVPDYRDGPVATTMVASG